MKNLTYLFVSICFTFTAVGFANSQTNLKTFDGKSKKGLSAKKKSNKRIKSDQKFLCQYVSVTDVALSQVVIDPACPLADEICSGNRIIKVRTVAVDTDNQKYVYTVSAGKIIGEGAEVEWDLSDVKPGIYAITAGISLLDIDGKTWKVFGMTKTKTVTIKE